jgi:transcriptional regulator with XRE-family HTH domain
MSALRQLRINARLSVPELAARSKVSPEQIRNIERGDVANPRARTLGRLADVLKVEPATLDPRSSREAA